MLDEIALGEKTMILPYGYMFHSDFIIIWHKKIKFIQVLLYLNLKQLYLLIIFLFVLNYNIQLYYIV